MTVAHSSLAERRRRIDEIDLRLVKLLNERAKVVIEIAHCKRRGSMGVLDKAREESVLQYASTKNAGPFEPQAVSRIFRAILQESRRLQKKVIYPRNRPGTGVHKGRK
jgi:chorismate mutase